MSLLFIFNLILGLSKGLICIGNVIIHNIDISNQNKALTQFADSAKQFLVDGNISLTLMSHMKLYE